MSLLDDVAERDGWRCWVCDEPVDPEMSVNDPRGPSVDSRTTDRKAKVAEPLAHRECKTRKGAVEVVIAWPDRLYVADTRPSPDEQEAALFRVSVVDLIDVALEEIVWARLGLA